MNVEVRAATQPTPGWGSLVAAVGISAQSMYYIRLNASRMNYIRLKSDSHGKGATQPPNLSVRYVEKYYEKV